MKYHEIITEEYLNLFEMSNLFPRTTGLPMTIFVSPRGQAKHDARIKVCITHGNRMNTENLAVVSIRPEPHLLYGELDKNDLLLVYKWILLNKNPLIAYWDETIDTAELISQLKSIK